MKTGVAVMVVALTGEAVETKVSRVYFDVKAAVKYKDSLEEDIKNGIRKDVLAVWIQEAVRIY